MTVDLRQRKYALDIHGKEMDGQEVVVAGWMQEIRDMGKMAFIILRDRSGTLQVFAMKAKVDEALYLTLTKDLQRESVIAVRGHVKASDKARNGYEIIPSEVRVLNPAEAPLPMGIVDKVDVDFETRLDNRFLDLRKPDVAAIFRVRSALVKAGIDSFTRMGFCQVHTPRIIGASSEGGTDLFPVKYFEKDAYLAQSPQLYKQMLMATGMDRQFEVATYFRAEKHNSYRHLNEVTAFDVEMAFIESEEEVLHVLETAVRDMWAGVHEHCRSELAILQKEVKVPALPFPRVHYDDALKMVNETKRWTNDKGEVAEIPWGDDLNAAAEKILGDVMVAKGHHFYFITKYPETIRPFYTYVEEGTAVTRSFDLEHNGLEVTSGAQRQHDPKKLESRIRDKGLDPADFTDYLKPFRYGMPPHGGFGLGIDRLTMEVLGLANVREAVLFPRDRTRLAP
ncbi:MAG TPA: aspartate--tRNA(Asn) ligase [Candidatus Thermoplasmatota archaeon]|nr:aspartate--tRNA(Asn) ligase [Candidatus Thermoplasmatota archaeon]